MEAISRVTTSLFSESMSFSWLMVLMLPIMFLLLLLPEEEKKVLSRSFVLLTRVACEKSLRLD